MKRSLRWKSNAPGRQQLYDSLKRFLSEVLQDYGDAFLIVLNEELSNGPAAVRTEIAALLPILAVQFEDASGKGSGRVPQDEGASNFLLSVVRGVQPRDELEAMLAVQMGAIHQATMMMARRLNHVDTTTQQDAAERALNKLARTYATQMDALKRYRTGGQQKVTVEHVTVNKGGQAIVGDVTSRGRG